MPKDRGRPDLSCVPVNPSDLYRVLATALGRDPLALQTVADPDIIAQEFPSVADPAFRDAYLLREILRKYPDFELGIDTSAAALSSFLDDERLNAATNDRLLTYDVGKPQYSRLIESAAKKVVAVLGKFRWDWLLEGARFGPGATTRLSGETASVREKLSGVPHVSRSAYSLAREVLSVTPSWGNAVRHESEDPFVDYQSDDAVELEEAAEAKVQENIRIRSLNLPLTIVDWDRFATVPKSAVTDRTIGIPPCMNIYLQLGVGYHMRKRMYPWGINLNDQSINQRRALEGSITGLLATLDLKSASNSVTKVLVWKLIGDHSHDWPGFDPTWYKVLDALRTEGCLIGKKLHEYELFSAMGNGFTFELESLIFWALAHAVCDSLGVPANVTIYGDDLVVPVECVEVLIDLLAHCGFRLNMAKSFWTTTGPLFRESCGVHYLDGRDVTPFYVDTCLNTADQIILLANNLVRWARRNDGSLDGRILPVYMWVVGHLSAGFLDFCIPFGEQNDGLLSSFDLACPSTAYLGNPVIPGVPRPPRAQLKIGYRVKTVQLETRLRNLDGEDALRVWLYEASKKRFTLPSPSFLSEAFEKLPTEGWWDTWYGYKMYGAPRGPQQSVRFVVPGKEPVNSLKKELKTGKRVVQQWPLLGPWVRDDEVLDLTFDDLRYAMNRVKALNATRVVKMDPPQGEPVIIDQACLQKRLGWFEEPDERVPPADLEWSTVFPDDITRRAYMEQAEIFRDLLRSENRPVQFHVPMT